MTDKIDSVDILIIENILTLYNNKIMGSNVAHEEWPRIDHILKSLPQILSNQEKAKLWNKELELRGISGCGESVFYKLEKLEQQNKKLKDEVRQLQDTIQSQKGQMNWQDHENKKLEAEHEIVERLIDNIIELKKVKNLGGITALQINLLHSILGYRK
jgi:hypothetical protein